MKSCISQVKCEKLDSLNSARTNERGRTLDRLNGPSRSLHALVAVGIEYVVLCYNLYNV